MKVPTIEPLEARIAPAILTISAIDSSKAEGSTLGSTTDFQFKVTLDAAEPQDVTVVATIADGTARFEDGDFGAFTQTITIPKGATEAIFTVPIKQDTTIEGNETFSVILSSPSINATIGSGTASATILTDDLPKVSVVRLDDTLREGSAPGGKTNFNFDVVLDRVSDTDITVVINSKDGTAKVADGDYDEFTQTVTIPAGQLKAPSPVSIPIKHDAIVEGDETFSVELSSPSSNAILGTSTATVTIDDDDPARLSIASATVIEGALGETKLLRFKVTLSTEASEDVTFDWATDLAGTASGGIDFTTVGTTQGKILAGQREVFIDVPILGDNTDELDETVQVTLRNAKMGANPLTIEGANGNGVVSRFGTIQNDDRTVTLSGPGTIVEGNSPNATFAEYIVTLSSASEHDVHLAFDLESGTAKLTSDFNLPTSVNLTIPAGSTTATLRVPITVDNIFEADETFKVRVKSVTNALLSGSDFVETTIVNDDSAPSLSFSNLTPVETTEADSDVQFSITVTLSQASGQDVTFNWSTVNGTALAGLDFEAVSDPTITIPAGQTTATILLKSKGDKIHETSTIVVNAETGETKRAETFSVALTGATGATIDSGASNRAVRIFDTDAAPILKIEDTSAFENAGGLHFRVSITNDVTSDAPIQFNWVAGLGSATPGVDYTVVTGSPATLPANASEMMLDLDITNDAADEIDETVQVGIVNAVMGSTNISIADGQATGRILNDDLSVSIQAITPNVTEGGVNTTTTAKYRISIPSASTHDVSVVVKFDADSSTATLGSDFTFPGGSTTVTIPAGQTFVDVDLTVNGDASFEVNDTITLKLEEPVNARIGTGTAVATIINDETNPPSLTIVDATVEEGADGNTVLNFTVKLSSPAGDDITFDWSTIDGTAIGGIDFSKVLNKQGKILKGSDTATISVAVSGDTLVEVDETFKIQLSNAKLGSTSIPITDGEAIGTIENDDIQVRIAGSSITEGTGGEKLLNFNITLTQVSEQRVTVTFKINEGTAKLGSDFREPVTLTAFIEPGQMSGTISIPILGDSLDEVNETFTVELTDATNASLGVSTATGTIADDDVAPVVSIEGVSLTEGDSGTKDFTFKVKLSAASGQEVRVIATPVAGTATAGLDFLANVGTVVFALGPNGETATEAFFTVKVNGDTAFENDENFTVVLSNATGASVSPTNGTATGTIENGTDAKPTLTITAASADESAGTINFTINLSAASGLPITFTAATLNDTAQEGKDYAAKTQNFTIAPGQTTATFSIAITDDALFERGETLFANITNIVGASNTTAAAQGTINDNELLAPTVTVSDVKVIEGDATTPKTFKVTISLTQLAGSDVTFDWQLISDGSIPGGATLNEDFRLVGGQTSPFTIPAGESSVTLEFEAIGDTEDEPDETFSIKVSNPKLGGDTLNFTDGKHTSVVTLQNDDLSVSVADYTVVEGNNGTVTLRFAVTLSGATLHPVTVNYATQDGTAISTGAAGIKDFVAKTGTVTFTPGGSTTEYVEIVVNGDVTFDGTDQMKLILSAPTGVRILDGEATGTITDDDVRPVVSIDAPTTIKEDKDKATTSGTTRYEFKVRLDHASDETVEVSLSTADGTAFAGSDFTGITNQRVTFAPGETEKTVVVTILNDSIYEANQTFDLVLSDPLRATLPATPQSTVTIQPDDDVRPTIQITGQNILEGDNGERFISFTIQRTGATDEEIKFDFETINGTAIAGVDFVGIDEEMTMLPGESTKTVLVTVKSDTLDEIDEQFQARITPKAGPGEGAIPGATLAEGHNGTATATIFNDDLTVTLDQGVIQVLEGNSGQADLVFIVKLSSKSGTFNHPTEVTYEILQSAGTATFDTDYRAPSVLTVTIPAGQSTGEIRIPIVGDNLAEAAETVSIRLTDAKNAELGTSDLTATGTILNDDASLTITNAHRIEGTNGSAKMVFTVKLDAAFNYPVTVNYATADGSATAGSDYTATQGTVTFALGQTEQVIEVPILGDTAVEGDETFSVVLSNPSNASILTGTGIGTIQDDEASFSINDVSIDEGDGGTRTMVFTITRAPGSSVGATVRVSTVDGTAISTGAAPDFIAKSEVITFAPNETSKTFSVVLNGDRVYEVNPESFFVQLSDATGAAILDGEGTGTITNGADAPADPLTMRISDATVVEGHFGTKVLKFTVTLSQATDSPVKFRFKTAESAAGNTAEGTDFGSIDQEFTIPGGQSTYDVEVVINGDTAVEGNEILQGLISNATYIPPGQTQPVVIQITDNQGIGTIQEDDAFVTIEKTVIQDELNSGTNNIPVVVTLRDANGNPVIAQEDVEVTFQLAAGTATSGTDFTVPTELKTTILKGQSQGTISVPVTGDELHENNETVTVTLTGATNAQLGDAASTVSTVTIRNDDAAPTLIVGDISAVEGSNASFKVELTKVSGRDVLVKWVTEFVPDSADPSDFTHFGVVQTLVIPAGQTVGTINIPVTQENVAELAETFKLRILTTTEGAAVTSDILRTATIGANDLGEFRISDSQLIEGSTGSSQMAFTVTRTASSFPASIGYVTSDGAAKVADGDYDFATGTIDFAVGETSKTIFITINGDLKSEADETFFVSLVNPVNGTIGDTSGVGKILNDEVTYSIEFTNKDGTPLTGGNKVVEGDGGDEEPNVYFRIVRTGAVGALGIAGSVVYSTGQNPASGAVLATAGSDYTSASGTASFSASTTAVRQESKVLSVPITRDMIAEGDETFLLKLSAAVNGQLSETNSESVITIQDDDSGKLPYVVIENAKLVEGAAGATSEMVFKVKLVDSTKTVAQATGGTITVTYSTADLIAEVGKGDYTAAAANATVTFAPGETEKEIRVPILGDSEDEVDETFNVKLESATFTLPGITGNTPVPADHLQTAPAVGTITNDDLTIALAPISQFEGDSAAGNKIVVKATLSQAATHAGSFVVKTKDGTATSGTGGDFVAYDQVVSFATGATEVTFEIFVNGDVYSEGDESFTILLSDAINASLGTTSQTMTILNDDAAPTLSIGDASIVEGDNGQANLVFIVVLSGATNQTVTFDYKTVDGTAKSSGALIDYIAKNGSLKFDPSSSATRTTTISIPIRGDTWKELTEDFTVQLSNAMIGGSTTGVSITDATATGQILDNGDTILGVIVHDAKAVEGGAMQFTIETTAPVEGSAITLKANTRTAIANAADFTALQNHTVTIGVGESQATVTVTTTADNFFEAPEHLLLDVTGFNANVKAVDGGATTVTAAGVILNDDLKIINSRQFQYVDTDGDLVTVKFSKGTLRIQGLTNSNAPNITFTAGGAVGGRNLDLINLAVDGFAWEGVSISVTAKPQVLVTGEVLGDAKADVGTLAAASLNADLFQISSGIGLGKVKISGNLDQLITGSTKRPLGARLIEVGSFGSDSDQGSVVLGPIAKFIVHGDFMGNIRLIGDAAAQPIPGGGVGRIGNLVIEGNLLGGTKTGSGRITFTGGIGTAKIGGIIGGSGQASGSISAFGNEFNTRIGSLTVLGDMVGGSGENSAFVDVDVLNSLVLGKANRTPSQTISGSLIGGVGKQSGVISAVTIGSVRINGDIRGGSGETSGYLFTQNSIGSARLTGGVIGGTGKNAGGFEVDGLKGALSLGEGVQGGSGENSGRIIISGNAKSITLGKSGVDGGDLEGGSGKGSGQIGVGGTLSKFLAYGSIIGGKGASSGALSVGNTSGSGNLASAIIKGDIIGGSTDAPGVAGGVSSLIGSGFVEADRIGSITVEGTIRSGQNAGTALAKSGGIYSGDTIGKIKVGAVDGSAGVPVVISAVRSIGNATFRSDVAFLELLAGYSIPSEVNKPRGVLENAGATIGKVVFNDTLTASSVVAGVYAGSDGKFGTPDDVQTTNGNTTNPTPGNVQLISRIASVIIKNVSTSPEAPANAIVAEHINALKIGSTAVRLTSGPHNDGPGLAGPAGQQLQIFEI